MLITPVPTHLPSLPGPLVCVRKQGGLSVPLPANLQVSSRSSQLTTPREKHRKHPHTGPSHLYTHFSLCHSLSYSPSKSQIGLSSSPHPGSNRGTHLAARKHPHTGPSHPYTHYSLCYSLSHSPSRSQVGLSSSPQHMPPW